MPLSEALRASRISSCQYGLTLQGLVAELGRLRNYGSATASETPSSAATTALAWRPTSVQSIPHAVQGLRQAQEDWDQDVMEDYERFALEPMHLNKTWEDVMQRKVQGGATIQALRVHDRRMPPGEVEMPRLRSVLCVRRFAPIPPAMTSAGDVCGRRRLLFFRHVVDHTDHE